MTRNGKIARLPRLVRDELNSRLDDGQQGTDVVQWLNAHPDVQRVLSGSFDGRPITEGNLTEWKQGGFLEWKRQQEACDWARIVAGEADQIAAASGLVPLSDRLSAMVSLALGRLIRELPQGSLADPAAHERFMDLLNQLTRLRRDDHEAARLKMDMETYEIGLRNRLRNNSLTSIPVRQNAVEFD